MVRKDNQGRILCTSNRRDGEKCRAPALKGATVCKVHGGQLPVVKAKAARVLLEELIEPMVAEAARMVESPKTSDSVKVQLLKIVLDYSGYKPPTQIEMLPTEAQVEYWINQLEAGA